MRRWFPDLFPWSEQAAFEFFITAASGVLGIVGLLSGIGLGYDSAGIGGALLSGGVLGVLGVVVGGIFGAVGPVFITTMLNLVIVIAPIVAVGGILSALWNVRL